MLRAGTDTGSLINHLYSRMVKDEPEITVGMGATILAWTDRYAGTVISIEKGVVTVQLDNFRRTDSNGISEDQQYEYFRDEQAPIYCFRKDKKGFWRAVRKNERTGRWNRADGYGIRMGVREKYEDPCF